MRSNKIKGGLYGSALGDSLGAITEFLTFHQIKDLFNNQLEDYISQPKFIEMGGILGTVTDDFGSSYYIMKKLIETKGLLNKEIANKIIENWSQDAYYFKFAGPTTKKAVQFIKSGLPKEQDPGRKNNFVGQATNGAAMKAVPLGILAKGDLDLAIQYAIDMSYPTHFNSLAVAGACAVSASVAQAQMENVTLDLIIKAGVYGAEIGQKYMEELKLYAIGPDMSYRIKEAVRIGSQCNSYHELIEAVDKKIGTNMDVSESVAAVYGIIAGVKGDCMQGIKIAVNAGGDTDTMAAMIGGILGSYQGIEVLPVDKLDFIIKNNSYIDIKGVINQFSDMIEKR